jgi:hypothetical protein
VTFIDFSVQALKDMDVQTLRKVLGNANLPSWINFPGNQALSLQNGILHPTETVYAFDQRPYPLVSL